MRICSIFIARKDIDMAYQVTRSKRITETLELTDANGIVVNSINVNLDADAVCTAFRKKQIAIIDAERRLKDVQRKGSQADLDAAYEAYGDAMLNIFELIFGDEGTKKILEFYENNYVEMGLQIVPFIREIVIPKLDDALKSHKRQMKNLYKSRI